MPDNSFLSHLKRHSVQIVLLALLLLVASFESPRQVPGDPTALIDAVVVEVITDIGQNKDLYEKDSAQLRRMIDTRIAPHFDFTRITRLAMAKHWDQASDAQKLALIENFQALLVRTYGNSLLGVPTDDPASHYRIRSQQRVGSYTLMVNMDVERTVGNPVALSLRMENRTGDWQVVDVVINGVSTVITYRTQFDMLIQERGIDGLIEALAQKRLPANG